jgi:hypothetical protein
MKAGKLLYMAKLKKYTFFINADLTIIADSKRTAWKKATDELEKMSFNREMQFGWFITKCEVTTLETS